MSLLELSEPISNRIHPALDFVSEHAYIGQMLPTQGRSTENENRCLFLIRDDKKVVICERSNLEQNALELVHSDFCFEPRWSLESIQKFCRGEITATEKAQLLEKLKNEFTTYIEFSDERLYDFLALWSIGTYLFPLFNTYPYVYVGGISQSGKTKLLTLCSCICFNSIPSANMTTATIYRLIQNNRCSLFIDETEQLSSRYRAVDFRNILLNGYKKGLRTYRNRRTQDGNFVPESFEVYGPKMLANIEGLEDVLESRCITIIMQRGSNREITNKEVGENDPVWQQIRDLIYPFLMKNWKEIRRTYSEFENDTTLACREWELWKPIFSLAKFFDSTDLLERMKNLALEKSEESRRDDLGRLLRRLGFSNRRRVGSGTEYFFKVSEVTNLAQRLGISEVSEHSELSEGTGGQGTQNNQG